jgi:hypothetical protein
MQDAGRALKQRPVGSPVGVCRSSWRYFMRSSLQQRIGCESGEKPEAMDQGWKPDIEDAIGLVKLNWPGMRAQTKTS